MQIKRQDLVNALEICKPALSTTSRAAELTHFWFTKDRISAYNGYISITYLLSTDIEAGVPDTLLDWLNKTASDTVTLTIKGDTLMAVSGRSRASFATLDPKRQLATKLPDIKHKLPIDTGFVEALSNVIVSHDSKSTEPAKLGVFVETDGIYAELHTTDDRTISKQTVALQDNWPPLDYFVIPNHFVKQIFKFLPAGGALHLSDNTISLITRTVIVTASLIEAKMPDFARIIDSFNKPDIPIPAGFIEALERVTLLNDEIQIEIADDHLHLSSSNNKNRIEEELALASAGHDDIMATFNAKLLKRALPGRTHLSIHPRGMRLTGPSGFVHLVGRLE